MGRNKNQRTLLERKVLEFIRQHQLILPGDLVVGVSGGPDSVCLLYLLAKLQHELGLCLHVAHLNHQLRGGESEADALYVAQLAQQLGLPATIESRDVDAFRREHRCSPEEAAREVRYSFLSEVASATSAHRVAVGHTAADQVETILMHIIRGSGTRGLRGLQPIGVWKAGYGSATVKVLRPLLAISREETIAYCHSHGLSPCMDSTNPSPAFFRNRLRQELLPLLQKYNPNFQHSLLQLAQIAGDDYAFVEKQALSKWPEIAQEKDGVVIFDLPKLISLPLALQRIIFYSALERLRGSPKGIEAKHIEQMIATLSKPAGTRISLPANITFYREYDRCFLAPPGEVLCPFPPLEDGEISLNVPGTTLMPGWQVEATILFGMPGDKDARFIAYLDLRAMGEGLVVRQRRRGDVFQPLGMDQPKKLQDFMVDAKVPRLWRSRVPLVCSPAGILWVVGYRIAEGVRVRKETEQVLRLEFTTTDS